MWDDFIITYLFNIAHNNNNNKNKNKKLAVEPTQ